MVVQDFWQKTLKNQLFLKFGSENHWKNNGFGTPNIKNIMFFNGLKNIEKLMVLQYFLQKSLKKCTAFTNFQCRSEKTLCFHWFSGPEIRISPDQQFFPPFNKGFNTNRQHRNRPQIFRILDDFRRRSGNQKIIEKRCVF